VGKAKPETFTFLGFTMICGQKRMGGFQLQRRTRRDRMVGELNVQVVALQPLD
jgi:hypothetical protein